MNNERARIMLGQVDSSEVDRDPLQALPVIDGSFKGMTLPTRPILLCGAV